MRFQQWMNRVPPQFDPKRGPPHCFVVAPPTGASKSRTYDRTVLRVEQVVYKFASRVFGLNPGVEADYDCPELDGPQLLRVLHKDPALARRLLANYFLSLLGEEDLVLYLRERCVPLVQAPEGRGKKGNGHNGHNGHNGRRKSGNGTRQG